MSISTDRYIFHDLVCLQRLPALNTMSIYFDTKFLVRLMKVHKTGRL